MPHRAFFAFIFPSLLAMVLFIAVPIISVVYQSFYIQHKQIIVESQTCGPFGCTTEARVDTAAMEQKNKEHPMGLFNGLGTYTNDTHLAFNKIKEIFSTSTGIGEIYSRIMNLPFYKALIFTLSYTFIVTPLVIIFGFLVALLVNIAPKKLKGPSVFFSLLPMLVTPLVGSLVLFWMIDSRGVIGSALQLLFDDPSLSLKASPLLTWLTLYAYGVWNNLPFAFVIFYAGLQTVPQDTLESAKIDGANHFQLITNVVLPHLLPLTTFIALIQIMDNFRVFEPIIGLSAEANATSLSVLIYNDLVTGQAPLFGSAAATSMMTIIGVALLLTPVVVRTWRQFNTKPKGI